MLLWLLLGALAAPDALAPKEGNTGSWARSAAQRAGTKIWAELSAQHGMSSKGQREGSLEMKEATADGAEVIGPPSRERAADTNRWRDVCAAGPALPKPCRKGRRKRGEAPIHNFVFANTTRLSEKSLAWFALQTADFKAIVETHQRDRELDHTLSQLQRLGGYNFFCSPAAFSDRSVQGNFGGTIFGASSHIKQLPLTRFY